MNGKTHSSTSVPDSRDAYPVGTLHQAHAVVLLRWVLIVATSYLVLFSRPLSEVTPAVALFVAAYLASNIALTELLPRLRSAALLDWLLITVDTAALTIAVILTAPASTDLFVLYFVILFLSALSERVGMVVGAAMLFSVAHLYTVSQYNPGVLLEPAYLLRIPFLFVVALFFSHVVHHTRVRERAVEAGRERDLRLDVLSAVSHDLKNPLGVIDSLADLLLDGSAGPLNDQQTDLARRIRASTRQVMSLSQNLIDAERVEAGRMVVAPRRANLGKVIDDALVFARSASAIKGVALHVDVEPGLPLIAIDTVQMERVVANLVGNAIKFTPTGGRVRLSAGRQYHAIVLAVTDDGPGIPPDELPRLAERHFRGIRTRGVEGSGLGLFIVRAVVEAHGGTLRASSGFSGGTTFTVTLPLDQSQPVGAEETAADPALLPRVAHAG